MQKEKKKQEEDKLTALQKLVQANYLGCNVYPLF